MYNTELIYKMAVTFETLPPSHLTVVLTFYIMSIFVTHRIFNVILFIVLSFTSFIFWSVYLHLFLVLKSHPSSSLASIFHIKIETQSAVPFLKRRSLKLYKRGHEKSSPSAAYSRASKSSLPSTNTVSRYCKTFIRNLN